jgi:PEP-CTERM motif
MKKLICLIALFTAVLSSNAYAYNELRYSANHSNLGALASPGEITDTFPTWMEQALLSFEIQGYGSLDGANAYSDVFTLVVNGQTLLVGTWDLGGGGDNVIYLNRNNAVVNAVSNGSFAGGKVSVKVPINLGYQSTSITFSYSGTAQGLSDEGWGINHVMVTHVPEPEAYAMLLAGLGLLGFMTRRKSGRQAA